MDCNDDNDLLGRLTLDEYNMALNVQYKNLVGHSFSVRICPWWHLRHCWSQGLTLKGDIIFTVSSYKWKVKTRKRVLFKYCSWLSDISLAFNENDCRNIAWLTNSAVIDSMFWWSPIRQDRKRFWHDSGV